MTYSPLTPARRLVALAAILAAFGGPGRALANSPSALLKQEQQQAEQLYIANATGPVIAASPACTRVPAPPPNPGPAPASLTSVVGVLGTPPPTTTSPVAFLNPLLQLQAGLYTNSVRLAQSAFGVAFYVFVSDGPAYGLPPASVNRCLAAQNAAVVRALRGIQKALRAPTLRMLKSQLSRERRAYAQAGLPGVGLIASNLTTNTGGVGTGGVGGTVGVAQIERAGSLFSEGTWTPQTVVAILVPNGVASVTFDYAATPAARATAITAPAVNNLAVISTTEAPTTLPKTVWRAADGAIIKTVPAP